jgi:hypothetical protein
MYLPPDVKELSGFAAQGKPGAEDIRASWDDWMVCGQVDGLPTASALARFACGAAPIPFAPYPPSLSCLGPNFRTEALSNDSKHPRPGIRGAHGSRQLEPAAAGNAGEFYNTSALHL